MRTGPLLLHCARTHTPAKYRSPTDCASSSLPPQARKMGVAWGTISAQLWRARGGGRRGLVSLLGHDSLCPESCKARAALGTPGTGAFQPSKELGQLPFPRRARTAAWVCPLGPVWPSSCPWPGGAEGQAGSLLPLNFPCTGSRASLILPVFHRGSRLGSLTPSWLLRVLPGRFLIRTCFLPPHGCPGCFSFLEQATRAQP